MTERLKDLLHAETDHLAVPPPATGEVLASGHRLVRRRRIGLAVGAAGVASVMVAAVAVGTGLGTPSRHDRTPQGVDPATAAYLTDGAWARGSTVHVGDTTATVKGAVKSLYYTSAGVVVRSGNVPWTDDSGPSQYGLVGPDGSVSGLGLDLGDRVPATDPSQPYLAYADGSGRSWAVKVVDVRTGRQVADVPFTADFTWGGWQAPPVALSGDTAYVGVDGTGLAIDWRTGDVSSPDWLEKSRVPEVDGDHLVTVDQHFAKHAAPTVDLAILDVHTGQTVLSENLDAWGYFTLSPDGRYAKLVVDSMSADQGPQGFDVHDLETGTRQHFPGQAWDYGWTPDGHLLKVTEHTWSVCSPTSGRCDDTAVDPGRGELRIAGNSYES